MANEYQKINTLFMRDANNIIMPDKMTCPEFDYLKDCRWECTEKIDGTNIHIDYLITQTFDDNANVTGSGFEANICGRTANAQIPAHLEKKLAELFWPDEDEQFNQFSEKFNNTFAQAIEKFIINKEPTLRISLYGEGYGVKIQKGGNYIKNDVGFILFDVRVGDWWLTREACEEIAQQLNIPIVPLIGYMTIPEAIEYVKKGFKSTIAENPDYDAEGLVLKTPYGLQFRNGQRIITKIKTCDFQKYRQKYGDGPVEQIPNPNYKK
jgi:hypothetical protein